MSAPKAWTELPMFFDSPAFTALGEELASKIDGHDARLHGDPRGVAARMAELGLFDLVVPAAHGGRAVGDGALERPSVRALCIVRELLGYASPMADGIFAVQGLSSQPIAMAGGAGARDLLTDVISGAEIGAFALTEPEAGSDVASLRTTARRDGDAWVLDGEKTFISNVGIATYHVVFANADPAAGKKGISAFVVPNGAPGLTTGAIEIGDHPIGRLIMKGCRVPGKALLGEVGQGMRLALGALDLFRTSVGAAAVGMARRALDETLAHVTARTQFGQKLAQFQLTQAALADMATDLDAARLLVLRAAWQKDAGAKANADVAMAKMFATEAAQRVIDRAVQLHGGLGVVSGTVVERLYREIRPLRIYEGTTEIQKLILGGALVAAVAPAPGRGAT